MLPLFSGLTNLFRNQHSNCLWGINCHCRVYLRFSACWSLITTIWYIIYTAPSLFLASLSITVCMSSIACKMLSLCMLQHVSIICHLPWMVTLLPIICLPQAKQNVQNRKIWGHTLCWYLVYGEKVMDWLFWVIMCGAIPYICLHAAYQLSPFHWVELGTKKISFDDSLFLSTFLHFSNDCRSSSIFTKG